MKDFVFLKLLIFKILFYDCHPLGVFSPRLTEISSRPHETEAIRSVCRVVDADRFFHL